jgi:hypothetical protein
MARLCNAKLILAKSSRFERSISVTLLKSFWAVVILGNVVRIPLALWSTPRHESRTHLFTQWTLKQHFFIL